MKNQTSIPGARPWALSGEGGIQLQGQTVLEGVGEPLGVTPLDQLPVVLELVEKNAKEAEVLGRPRRRGVQRYPSRGRLKISFKGQEEAHL